jgi:hypothetical protein
VEFEDEDHGYSSSNRIAKFLDELGHLIGRIGHHQQ